MKKKPHDITLQKLARDHGLTVDHDQLGDECIRGDYGQLYMDDGKLMVMMTDEGSNRHWDASHKGICLTRLKRTGGVVRVKLDCELEFIVQISERAIETAIDVLKCRKRRKPVNVQTGNRLVA